MYIVGEPVCAFVSLVRRTTVTSHIIARCYEHAHVSLHLCMRRRTWFKAHPTLAETLSNSGSMSLPRPTVCPRTVPPPSSSRVSRVSRVSRGSRVSSPHEEVDDVRPRSLVGMSYYHSS